MSYYVELIDGGRVAGPFNRHQEALWNLYNNVCKKPDGVSKENHDAALRETYCVTNDEGWHTETFNCYKCGKLESVGWNDCERDILQCRACGKTYNTYTEEMPEMSTS